uniref:Uncharacterized protein n=1 Tax=Helianthus annuus TaxID=4232 RepID=A0A251SAG9_HELAN
MCNTRYHVTWAPHVNIIIITRVTESQTNPPTKKSHHNYHLRLTGDFYRYFDCCLSWIQIKERQ